MDFRKISDTELRCSLTIDEIRAKGLEISDLIKKTEKTYEFFEQVVEEAELETGFEKTGPMSVEGMFLNGRLELTFRLVDTEEMDELAEVYAQDEADVSKSVSVQTISEDEFVQLSVVAFKQLEHVVAFAKKLNVSQKTASNLYKMDGYYYLILDLDDCKKAEIGQFCSLANEFADGTWYGDLQASFIMEHASLVCQDAVARMATI